MMVTDVDIFKRNCIEYSSTNKAVDVLRHANGKTHYKVIAKTLDVHHTTVSGLLKKAEKLGLATRVGSGFYKKIPGVLSYLPNKKVKLPKNKTVESLVKKVKKGSTTTKSSSSFSLSSKISTDLEKMAHAYRALYAVENTLRELIRNVLNKKVNWWENCVPKGVRDEVKKVIDKTRYDAANRNDELEYAHLGQLKEIIIDGNNWNDFLPFLHEKDKATFGVTVNRAISSRNAIGHCIPLKGDDLKFVEIRMLDIMKMIKQ